MRTKAGRHMSVKSSAIVGSTIVCILVAWPLQLAAATKSARLTLAKAQDLIREKGPAGALVALESQWDQLLDRIATGQEGWLDTAVALLPKSDAAASETLQ